MAKFYFFTILSCLFLSVGWGQSNTNCNNPSPFCTGSGGQYTFPAGVNAGSAQSGPNYGCLFSQPNPAWYFMQVANPGVLTMDINSTPYQDIDFICYGPFASLAGVCTAQLNAANTVDCSYSASGYEQVNINNAQTGQFYVVLITNFSNQPCNINFNLNAAQSSATTNCGILAGPVNNNGPICDGDTLQLTAQTVPNAISYVWSGPGGFSANTQNVTIPNATPAMSGTYSLVVSDISGSAPPVTTTVTVHPIPAAPTIGSNSPICEGQTLNLTAANVANGSFEWIGPNGYTSTQQNPTIPNTTAAMAGQYQCRVKVNNCWSPYATINVVIHPKPVPVITGPHYICEGALATLGTSIPYQTYQWSNNQNTPTINVSTGNYTVTVTDANNCQGSSGAFNVAFSLPSVTITGIQIYCLGQSIQLSATGGNFQTYTWSTGSGASVANTFGGQVWVDVTDSIGCHATDTVVTTPEPLPVPDFTFTNVCHMFQMPFTDASTIASGTVTGWQWNFGNGQSSQLQNPQNMFPNDGTFPVKLVAISNHGCKDSITKNVTVYPLPNANFVAQSGSGCIPLFVNFQNLSTVTSGSIVTYNWDLGLGATSGNINPQKGYNVVDSFAVTLIAITDKGCTDTTTIIDAVKTWPNPIADFTFDPEDVFMDNPTVNFNDQSIGAISWVWNFGDGNSSINQFPTNVYGAPGSYQVNLDVVNQYGCTDNVQYTVLVQSNFAVFIPNSFTPNEDGLNDLFTITGNGIITYELFIFDRWGKLITQGANISWDGKIQGSLGKEDTYIYKVRAYDITGLEYNFDGFVNLVR